MVTSMNRVTTVRSESWSMTRRPRAGVCVPLRTWAVSMLLLSAAWVSDSSAGTLFRATLDGAQMVPPVETPATGDLEFYLSHDQTRARLEIRVRDLPNVMTASHVHVGSPGQNGPQVFDLGVFADSIAADWPIAPSLVPQLLAGNLYVAVHTDVYPVGEIRGQITRAASMSFIGTLSGGAEVPPNGSGGTGIADWTLAGDWTRLHLDLTVSGLSSPMIACHVHRGLPGQSGPHVYDLGVFTDRLVRNLAPTSEEVSDLLAGLHYVNVHTALLPSGELRAQLGNVSPATAPDAGAVLKTSIHVWPSPFTDRTHIQWEGGSLGAAGVQIVDAAGRRIWAAEPGAGTGVTWDGRDLSGRSVPPGRYWLVSGRASCALVRLAL